MTTPIVLRYHNTQRDMADAMIAAGKAIAGKKRNWPFFVGSIAVVYLATVGGLAIGALIWNAALDQSGSIVPWLFVGGIMGLAITFLTYRRMIWVQAAATLNSRFCASQQHMSLGPDGVVLSNDVAHWQTDWAGVEAVVAMKSGMAIVVSGIVYPVPNASFNATTPKADALAHAQAWHAAAQG